MSSASLGLIDPLLRNVQDLNNQTPTPVHRALRRREDSTALF
ncbi:hypothetical protein BH160DRAFT_2526 [Burkholderia sp. H160]|nr:hypothetical protein BH160DRAFT_2526 [Burkholderia sp. H160]